MFYFQNLLQYMEEILINLAEYTHVYKYNFTLCLFNADLHY